MRRCWSSPAISRCSSLPESSSGPSSAPASSRKRRFAVIVPAHNEETVIAATLASLNDLDYPRALFDVHVIADNCDDATAAVARDYTPFVHERTDRTAMGKGQALRWLFDRLPADALRRLRHRRRRQSCIRQLPVLR